MPADRAGGAALFASAIMMLVTMMFHPTHAKVAGDPHGQGPLTLAVHALALAAAPIAFYGALVLTRRLAEAGALAELALVFFGFAGVATMLAATASGLLATPLIARILDAQGEARAAAEAVGRYNAATNQAFAKVYVGMSSTAIALWSVALLRTRLMKVGAGILGCVVAGLTLLALFSGHLRLDVHGFGAVVFGQAMWFIVVGSHLWGRVGASRPLTG